MTLTGKISITEASCHPLEFVNLSFILITRILHLKERKIRKWGWWRHILLVWFWLLLRKKVKTTFSQPLTQIQSLTVTVTAQNDITKILIKKFWEGCVFPPPWIPYKEVWPSFWCSLSLITLPLGATDPPSPQEKLSFPQTQSMLSRSLKYSIPIWLKRPKCTFKRVHSTKTITKKFRLTFDNWRVSENTSSYTLL